MSGHGHVYPNEDGSKARCGGPAICAECAREQAQLNAAGNFAKQTSANQYTDPHAVAAHLLEAMKNQVLICMVERLGGRVEIPVDEVDGTGRYMMEMTVDQANRTFTFTTSKKS